MVEVPVYNPSGQKVDTWQVDELVFGGKVNVSLLKQAVVAYHANLRQGTVGTKSRGMVDGSTKKMYAQKHTGNARRGNIRTNLLKGGGVAFAKRTRDFRRGLPKQMRRAALGSAILAKMLGNDLMILDGLQVAAPKTKAMASMLKNLNINRSCVLALAGNDPNIYLSARNLRDLTVRVAGELSAFDVATRRKMIITSDAMKELIARGKEAKP